MCRVQDSGCGPATPRWHRTCASWLYAIMNTGVVGNNPLLRTFMASTIRWRSGLMSHLLRNRGTFPNLQAALVSLFLPPKPPCKTRWQHVCTSHRVSGLVQRLRIDRARSRSILTRSKRSIAYPQTRKMLSMLYVQAASTAWQSRLDSENQRCAEPVRRVS